MTGLLVALVIINSLQLLVLANLTNNMGRFMDAIFKAIRR